MARAPVVSITLIPVPGYVADFIQSSVPAAVPEINCSLLEFISASIPKLPLVQPG